VGGGEAGCGTPGRCEAAIGLGHCAENDAPSAAYGTGRALAQENDPGRAAGVASLCQFEPGYPAIEIG
jgi:hypothetical protein